MDYISQMDDMYRICNLNYTWIIIKTLLSENTANMFCSTFEKLRSHHYFINKLKLHCYIDKPISINSIKRTTMKVTALSNANITKKNLGQRITPRFYYGKNHWYVDIIYLVIYYFCYQHEEPMEGNTPLLKVKDK